MDGCFGTLFGGVCVGVGGGGIGGGGVVGRGGGHPFVGAQIFLGAHVGSLGVVLGALGTPVGSGT